METRIVNDANYRIVRAENSQLPEILNFLHENFDREETMLKSLLLDDCPRTEEENKLIRLDHERLLRGIFDHSPCLVAIDEASQKIIGVNLMIFGRNPKTLNGEDEIKTVYTANPPKTALMKQYFAFLTEFDEKVDLYEIFPSAKAGLEFYAIAVDKSYRRRGIAKSLTAEGISLAKNLQDVGFVFGIYTSVYSKKAAEKLGLKSYMDADLLECKNSSGQRIFRDTPPHNIISTMALEI